MNPITNENEEFTSTLSPQLVNVQTRADILAQCPHEDISPEIAVIAVSGKDHAPVTYNNAADYQLTKNELIAAAMQNQENTPYRLAPMENLLGLSTEDSGNTHLLVLTNRDAFLGSAEILNPSAMQEASDRLDSEVLYIIPSSTHEVILLSRDSGVTPDQLDTIIREVNREIVQPHERLSDHSLLYDRRTRSLSEAHAEQSQSEQTNTHPVRQSHDESSVNLAISAASIEQLENPHERRRRA